MKDITQRFLNSYNYLIPILGLIILSDRLLLGKYAIHKTHDGFDSFIPFLNQIIEKVYSFQLPGWNSDYLGGLPFNFMDINWLSLPVLIGGLLPFPLRMFLIEYIQVMIAGIGMYHFLEHNYKLKYNTKIIGSILWGYFLINMTYWRVQDLALIPLLLVSTQKIISDGKNYQWYWGLFICALDLTFVKGAPFIGLFHAVYFFLIDPNKTLKTFKIISLFWLFVILINMPVITTLIVNDDLGSRSLMKAYGLPNELTNLSDLLVRVNQFVLSPFLNIGNNFGVIVVALFVFSLLNIKTWHSNNKKLFSYYMLILFFVTFIDRSKLFIEYRQMMPLASFRLSRFLLVAPFILLLISLCNFEKFILFAKNNKFTSISVLFILTITLSYYHYNKHPFPSNYFQIVVEMFTFSSVLLILLIYSNKKNEFFSSLIGLTIIITYFLNIHLIRIADIHPPSYKHFFESDVFEQIRPKSKSDYRIAFINWHPTVGIENHMQVAGGYASQYLKRYALFWRELVTAEVDDFDNYNFKAYLIDNDVKIESTPPQKIQTLKINTNLLALNNVRYLFSLNEIVDSEKYGLKLSIEGNPYVRKYGVDRFKQIMLRIGENIPYFVYEVTNYFPRINVVKDAAVLNSDQELYQLLGSLNVKQLKNTIYYSSEGMTEQQKEKIVSYQAIERSDDNAHLFSDIQIEDDLISFEIKTDMPIQLLLNENYMRDWEVYIDGQQSVIIPAYNTLRSIIVDKGSHTVKMVYSPNYLFVSYLVSGSIFVMTLFIMIVLSLRFRIFSKQQLHVAHK